MKNIAAILILAVALIASAGCISTDDPMEGTWMKVGSEGEPFASFIDIEIGIDSVGQAGYILPNGREVANSMIWWKENETIYSCSETRIFFFENAHNMSAGYPNYFVLPENEEPIGGTWRLVTDDPAVSFTYVFNKDNTSTLTKAYHGEIIDVEEYEWEVYGKQHISIEVETFYTVNKDGTMTNIETGEIFEKVSPE